VYCYNGAQRYEQLLQVGWLYRALILRGLAVCLLSSSVSLSLWYTGAIYYFFCLHPSLCLLLSWAWCDWSLTWLTNYRLSVLWHCWFGHVTRKIVSEMTYNVSSGTLNTAIPDHTDAVSSHFMSVCLSVRCEMSKYSVVETLHLVSIVYCMQWIFCAFCSRFLVQLVARWFGVWLGPDNAVVSEACAACSSLVRRLTRTW